jgi:hypothetical protein
VIVGKVVFIKTRSVPLMPSEALQRGAVWKLQLRGRAAMPLHQMLMGWETVVGWLS